MIFSHPSILFVIILLILLLIWFRFSRDQRIEHFSKLNFGPKPLPLIGNVNVLYKQSIIQGFLNLKKHYGIPCGFWVYNDYYYITDSPEEIKAFLLNTNKSFQKSPFYDDLIMVLLGGGVFITKNVEQWRHERKLANKAFVHSLYNKYIPVFNKVAHRLTDDKMENIKDSVALLEVLNQNSFRTFMENFMGVTIGDKLTEDKLVKSLTRIIDIVFQRTLFKRTIPRLAYKYLTSEGREFFKAVLLVQNRLKQLIDEKQKEFHQKSEHEETSKDLPLLETLLLQEGRELSLDDITNMLISLYFASIDTTVLTLFYTLMLLGMYPNIQEKVLQEILDVVGVEEIQTNDLNKFEYLESCVLESLRIYPVVPLTGRYLTEDMIIGKKRFPKGLNVVIAPFLVHRNETYWKDPEIFDPSRFSSPKDIELGTFIPFLVGPRDCPGKHYGISQVKVMVANIVRKYKIKVNPKIKDTLKFNYFIVMKPSEKFDIEFLPRGNDWVL